MQIIQIMTKDPTCCAPTDVTQKAASIMKEEDTGIVPVIENEANRKLVGVVTDRDLCLAVVAAGRDPWIVTVEESMTDQLICCSVNDDTEKVLDLMLENQLRRIPVVDEEDRIQGIVSLADLARQPKIGNAKMRETLKKISEPTSKVGSARAKSR